MDNGTGQPGILVEEPCMCTPASVLLQDHILTVRVPT